MLVPARQVREDEAKDVGHSKEGVERVDENHNEVRRRQDEVRRRQDEDETKIGVCVV